MEIILGDGKYILTSVEREGEKGILFKPTEVGMGVDEIVEFNEKEYTPKEDDLIIWCKNLEGARVLQDKASYLALKLNRYTGDLTNDLLQIVD